MRTWTPGLEILVDIRYSVWPSCILTFSTRLCLMLHTGTWKKLTDLSQSPAYVHHLSRLVQLVGLSFKRSYRHRPAREKWLIQWYISTLPNFNHHTDGSEQFLLNYFHYTFRLVICCGRFMSLYQRWLSTEHSVLSVTYPHWPLYSPEVVFCKPLL